MKLLKQLAIVALICCGQSVLAMNTPLMHKSKTSKWRNEDASTMSNSEITCYFNKLHGIALERRQQKLIVIDSHTYKSLGLATNYIAIRNQLRALKEENDCLYNNFIHGNVCEESELEDYPILTAARLNAPNVLEHILKYNKPH